ncbi:MAG: hypothetical protein K2W92_07380 [Alphaproteobacteria bacterium]|nr:hypothetical protein [Alphaproteobacteria bacterium]
MKKIMALSVLSFLASQMSTTAITITEGMGAIEDFNERKTLRAFAKKERYKDVELIKIDFNDDEGKNSQETPSGSIVKFSDQETKEVVEKIKQREKYKQSSNERKTKWDYRDVYSFDHNETPGQKNLVIDFGQINDQEHFFALRSFFSNLSEKGRLKEEVRFVDSEGNYVVIAPNKIERFSGKSAEKFDAGDSRKIVETMWAKFFRYDDIDPAQEIYIVPEEDGFRTGQFRENLVIQLENIRTPEDTNIVRLVFDKLKKMGQLAGEVHLNTPNSRIIITQNRIKIDSPGSRSISMLEMGGINYQDQLEEILKTLPQAKPLKSLDEASLELLDESVHKEDNHDSFDEGHSPHSRRLSDSTDA